MAVDDGSTTATAHRAKHAGLDSAAQPNSDVSAETRESDLEPKEVAKEPGRPRRRTFLKLHGLTWLVFVLLTVAGVVTSVTAAGTVRNQEERQLQTLADRAVSVLSGSVGTVDTTISALIAASDGRTDHTVFDRLATPMVTGFAGQPAAYTTVFAAEQSAQGPVVTVSAGEIAEGTTLGPGRRADVLATAWKTPNVMHTTDVFREGGIRRIGIAKAGVRGGAVYVESRAAGYSGPSSSSGPWADIDGVVYATLTQQVDQVILSSIPISDLPPTGDYAKGGIPIGDDEWLLIVRPRTSLVGGLAEALPWILLAASIVTAVLAALTVEALARRRDYATALVAERTRELQAANEELEDRVADRTARLNASNQELEAFAFSVSHDLRAPLRAMEGFSRALVEDYSDKLDEHGRDYLGRVQAGAHRMDRLIDDVLDLSRVARAEISPQTVDLSALAVEIFAAQHLRDPLRGVNEVVADGLVAKGDPTLLRTLMENLIANAWKFTATHEAARIEVGATEDDGERVFFVRDDGVGFDMAYAAKLFRPFERLHDADQFPGTGVGLATVERIVRRHGGRIWGESAVGQGATFYFTLAARG